MGYMLVILVMFCFDNGVIVVMWEHGLYSQDTQVEAFWGQMGGICNLIEMVQ